MVRITVGLVLAAVAVFCLLQYANANSTFDFAEFIDTQLRKTIEKENLTCDNYKRFCHKSHQQFQTNGDSSTVEMSVTLCKLVLKTLLCAESQ